MSSDIRYDGQVRWLCQTLITRRTDDERDVLQLLAHGEDKIDDRILIRRLKKHIGLVEERNGKLALFADAFKYWVSHNTEQFEQRELRQANENMPMLEYWPDRQEVEIGDRIETLTPLENRLLKYFISKVDQVCTTQELLENVWGSDKSLSVVEKGVNRLRAKIEADSQRPRHILSIRGEGYVLRGETMSKH